MNTNLTPELLSLPWRADALQDIFSALHHRPWAMLLHSGFADHPHNRFDILVAEPRVTLTTRGAITMTQDAHGCQQSEEDPLRLLQAALARFAFAPRPDADLPFQGGALGLFGYDLGRASNGCPLRPPPMSTRRIWRSAFMTGR